MRRAAALLLGGLLSACLEPGELARPCDPLNDDCEAELICVPHEGGGACLADPGAPVCAFTEEVTLNPRLSSRGDLDAFIPPDFEGCVRLVGDLTIETAALTTLSGLEPLVEIDGDLRLFDNTRLTSLAGLNELRAVTGQVLVLENDALVEGGLARLQRAGALSWTGPAPETFALDALIEVEGELQLANLLGVRAVSLARLDGAGGLRVNFNPVLASVDAPLLSLDGPLEARDNPRLPVCDLEALAARTGASPVTLEGNAPCP